jgi:uncharacterized protein YyaL (SSP411 family)
MPNRLAAETSLYLRQHADNPVDWYPWGDEAFARADAEDRPVLLSVGYSSCHWCHVMAHESFEDPATAAVMNALFVCVKVDREERPDVDAVYMQATLALTGQGGWPMTVFLTPDRRPFHAGTYFPPIARGGMPGFADVCRAVSDAYLTRRRDVVAQAEEVTRRLRAAADRAASPAPVTAETVADAVVGLARAFDPAEGGFGGAPKFPPALPLEFLVACVRRRPADVNARHMLDLTLARMADGGIHDQIGGGFHRYAVDAHWRVPHFEKMLYDNALLARVYALAHEATGEARWAEVAGSTLDFLLGEMRVPGGGFASALDADSPGGEGAYFVWTPDELRALLPPDEAAAVELRYGVTASGNVEGGGTVLNAVAPVAEVSRALGRDAAPLLGSAQVTMARARARRPAPERDPKVVAAWNGLAIAALADGGRILGRPELVAAAGETAGVVLGRMVVDGRLHRTLQDGGARHPGQLDDHADVAHGLLRLYDATHDPRWLREARALADRAVAIFADPDGDGFFLSADGATLPARTRDLEDHPTPGGNAQIAGVLLRLADLTGEAAYEERAGRAVALVRDDLPRHPQALGAALLVADALAHPRRQIAVVGPRDDARTAALLETARAHALPGDVLVLGAAGDTAAAEAVPLLRGRGTVGGAPAAYVCRDHVCAAPVTTAEGLSEALRAG